MAAFNPLDNPYAPPATTGLPGVQDWEMQSSYQAERRSVLFLVFLSVITLGIYPAVWFIRRRQFLDSLDSTDKLGGMAAAPLVATIVSFALGFVLPDQLDRPVTIGCGAVTIITAFRVAKILRSDFARTGRFLGISGAGCFFFNALYLQYKINQAADTPARMPRAT
jgi:uncharacterized protein DUF4234